MGNFFGKLFDTDDFPARWQCGNWGLFEGWLHIASDAVICAAYIAIPLSLLVFVRKRRDFQFPKIVWLFVAFILSCGITHGFETLIFWWPAYRWTGILKFVTAAISVVTVIALWRTIPVALTIPSLTRRNSDLTDQLAEEVEVSETLRAERAGLERRAAELAVRERRIRDANAAARAVAVSWNIESGAITWELGYLPLLRAVELTGFDDILSWNALIGSEGASILRRMAMEAWTADKVMHTRFALRGYERVWDLRLTVTREPPVAGQPPAMVGLFGLVPYEQSRRMEDDYAG